MAFYGYNDDDGVGDCNWSPYSVNNSSSTYEFEEPISMNYYYYNNSNSNQFDYDTNTIQSAQHYYSVYSQTETSTVIQYEQQQTPSSYVYDSFYPHTNFIINYSTLEFNEPEFDEYDDTPYGGGYDIALTYGKPLPPSDQICYPRSTPQLANPDGFSYGSITSPYGRISDTKPKQNENGIKPVKEDNNSNVKEDHVIVENPIEDGDRVGVDEDLSFDDGISEGSDDQVPRYAYGSGLEAIDICDSIFGYWPCLEKRKQQYLPCNAIVYDQNQRDPWKTAADYLFGSGFMYEEEPRVMCRGHGYYFDGQHFDYSYNN